MFEPSAKVIADSISPRGHRLTTMEVTGHRFILSELNTHRVLSRNSASSRAIPYPKMRQKVIDELAFPVEWPSEKSGMQGGEPLSSSRLEGVKEIWANSAHSALLHADALHGMGLHKSVVNRIIEPYLPHTVIISATEWQGFYDQRCHPDAQPEIRSLAEAMREEYDNSTPNLLGYYEWHTPYISDEDRDLVQAYSDESGWGINEVTRAVSAARCARVSYLTHDGVRSIEKDIELYSRLKDHIPAHASPFEHVASPALGNIKGNFVGWQQLRHRLGLG